METRIPLKRLLAVDSSESFSIMLGRILGSNYTIGHVPTIGQGISRLGQGEIDLVLLTWEWPGPKPSTTEEIAELLKAAAELSVPIPVVALTGDARRETAMEIIKQGAYDFFVQPLDVLELKLVIDHASRLISLGRDLVEARGLASITHLGGLIGNSKPMQRVYDMVSKVAGVSTTVLLRGESGTGKEVMAHAIHRLSPRSGKAFMAFSPSALPETLLEDELFGHEKGAFTGAVQSRRGRFEEAQGGTVFMDEIGDLSLPVQAKLLRVLQERCFERLGSSTPVQVDIRLICATNRDLEKMVQDGAFRQDLYFRISVFRIDLPALRERRDDIPLLADYFCRHFAELHKKDIRGMAPGYVSALVRYDWPGNVRELQNVIERSLILSDGPQLAVQDLPPEFKPLVVSTPIPSGSFHDSLRYFKREMVMGALRGTAGNRQKAARDLQISRSYLHRLLKQLDILDEDAVAEHAVSVAKS